MSHLERAPSLGESSHFIPRVLLMSLFALAARTWNRKRHHFYCHFIILPFIWPLCNFCIGPMEATDFTDTRIQSRALTHARSSREPLSNTSETIDVILLKKFPKSFFFALLANNENTSTQLVFFRSPLVHHNDGRKKSERVHFISCQNDATWEIEIFLQHGKLQHSHLVEWHSPR